MYVYTDMTMYICMCVYASACRRNIRTYIYIYIYVYGTPQRLRFSYTNIQLGRWGSQSEIDGTDLRVGGFRV